MSLQTAMTRLKIRMFKRAAATVCHFKGQAAQRDRLITEIAMDSLAAFAERKGQVTALFSPERKFQHDLTAFSFGSLWFGMVNQPGEFQKRSIVAAARPLQQRMKLDGIQMDVRVVDGHRVGFTDQTPAVLEASFRPSPAATGTAPSALQQS